jgi:glycosyltransferase involved in cell wall biosynthesis
MPELSGPSCNLIKTILVSHFVTMKKITWFGVAQSPYNDYLLTEVNKYFDLRVFFKIKKKVTHPWQLKPVEYNLTYLPGHFFNALKRVFESNVIVVSGWSYWQHIIIMLLPLRRVKKIYWTDTPNLDKREWSGVKGFIRRMLVKLVFTVFDEVWSTGKPGCKALEQLGCPKEKIRSFPFFLDLSRYNNLSKEKRQKAKEFRDKYSNHPTDVIFLCMGQVAGKKRFADAIQALLLLKNKDAVLWIAGTGPQEEELKELSIRLGLVNQVYFLGWLQQNEVELAYISADVFVHPASFDPFPTVVLDAMTWGKPIVGTNVSGSVADRVVPNKNGFVFEEGDIEQLSSYMKFFLANKDEIHHFGLEARKTACSYPVDLAINKFRSLSVSSWPVTLQKKEQLLS